MPKWFASAGKKRLHFDPDDSSMWIDVKRELNREEQDQVLNSGMTDVELKDEKQRYGLSVANMNRTKLLVWIVGWNATRETQNESGETVEEPVPLSESALCNLYPPIAKKMLDAIEAYQESLEEEKKVQSGETVPESI